jgi:peptide/nickel transport system permease protein
VWIVTLSFLFVGLFAPLIANDVPLVASVDGDWSSPALVTLFGGSPPRTPDGETWKRWESRLPSDSKDWAVMPFIPYGPLETQRGYARNRPSMGVHYMGNDNTGRDVLARIIHGTRTALLIALGAVGLALLIGVPIGAAAGYWGGWVDVILNALVQTFLCFPPIFFVLAVMAFLGNSLWGMIIVLGLLYWVSFARIVRGEILSLREREFVKCARGLGVGPIRLIAHHILPVVRGPILVNAAFVAASAVVVESTLSFLGLGPGLSTVSWGMIMMQGKFHAATGAWHLWFFPSVVLILTVTCLHTLADRGRRVATG